MSLNSQPCKRQIGDFSYVPVERLTSETGAQKGMRITRMDLLPPNALREVSAVYGFGERKYPAGLDGPNWLRGMPYSWNIRAALDHIMEWQAGLDYDGEDGISPLAHAVWHLLAIMEFQSRGIGIDDRAYKMPETSQPFTAGLEKETINIMDVVKGFDVVGE